MGKPGRRAAEPADPLLFSGIELAGDDAKQEIQETVREMLEGMSSAAGKEMRSVIDALTLAADELRSAQGNIGSSGDQFGTALGMR